MDRNIVYHGSNVEVATPRILDMDFIALIMKNKQNVGQ